MTKRVIPLILLLVLLIAVMLISSQAIPVYAQGTETPTVTPLPTDSPVKLDCNYLNPGGTCTQSDDGRTVTIEYILTDTWRRNADELGVNIVMICLDGQTCTITDTFPVFYDLSSHTEWVCIDINGDLCGSGGASLWMDLDIQSHAIFTTTASAGAGAIGSGSIHETGIYTGAMYINGTFAVVQSQAYFNWWEVASYTTARYVISLDPIEDCEDNYIIGDLVGNYIVDASSETGNTHALEQGQFYRLQVTGGAWVDTVVPLGSARDDIRISQDDTTWTILGDTPGVPISGCLSASGISGGGYYFYAETGDLRVLVNDQPGDFANNAGEVAYSIYEATPIEYFFGCTQYAMGDLIWETAIDATDYFGALVPPIHVPFGEHALTPGELYAIEIIPPPYTHNGNNTYMAELATDGYPDLWYPLAQHPDVVCADVALDGRERVIILAGELPYYMHAPEYPFNIGELSYRLYAVTGVTPEVSTCPQFAISSVFYESFIPANTVLGERVPDVQNPETTYVPGQYYAIEIVVPPWADGMPPQLSFDAQMRASALPDDWVDFPDYTGFACVASLGDGRMRGYFLAQVNLLDYYMRADDHNNSFDDNNGDLNYIVYNASVVDTTPSACETLYDVGDDIYNGYMLGTSVGQGVAGDTALTDGQWYYLEVTGGPLIDLDGDAYYTMTIANIIEPSPTWYELDQWPEAACVGQTGPYTHIYFQAELGQDYHVAPLYADGNRALTRGSISWILKLATPVSGCGNFVLGDQLDTGYVQSTAISGTLVPRTMTLTVGDQYAFDSTNGPWYDDSTASYSATISEDGSTWYPLETYPNALCVEQLPDLLHTRIYFEANQETYYYRVNDGDSNFANNQGTLGWSLYGTTWNPPPPIISCDNNYTDTIQVATYVIPANAADGVTIDKIKPGITYKLQSTGGPWVDFDVDSYALQISDDAGQNWYDWADYFYKECLVTLTDHHQLLFFTANDGIYKIRVSDPQGNFNDNTGSMGVTLYSATYDPGGGEGGTPPPDWDGACATACTRPINVTNVQLGPWTLGPWTMGPWMVAMPSLNVSNWLEYGRCGIQQYFAWCPHHTLRWGDIGEIFADREPFGLVTEANDAGAAFRMMMDQYNWNDEMLFSMPITEGVDITNTQQLMGLGTTRLESVSSHPVTSFSDYFSVGSQPNSPYDGGLIDLSKTYPGSYTVNCTTSIKTFIGPKLSQSVCFAMSTMNHLGALSWFQLVVNFCVLVLILFQIKDLIKMSIAV